MTVFRISAINSRVMALVRASTALALLLTLFNGPDCANAASRASLEPAQKEWRQVGGDPGNTRYSTLTQINRSSIHRLGGAWFKELGAGTRTPPVVSDGVMYISDAASIYALSLKDGRTIWEYKPTGSAPARGGVAIGEGLVFSGLMDAHIVALDQKTGQPVWKGYVGAVPEDQLGAGGTANALNASAKDLEAAGVAGASNIKAGWIVNAPVYSRGIVVSGLSGGDVGARGRIFGLDAKTGKVIWNFDVIPSAGGLGSETWSSIDEAMHLGGGAIWSDGALDPDLGLVYFGTGNASSPTGGELRAGDNLFTACVVALELQTGKLRWYYQLTHHDIWEMDVSTPMVLYTARVNGKSVRALAAMRTDGYLFMLDRATGRALYPVEELPVRQDIRLRTSPTQPFPVNADEFGPNCADHESAPEGFELGCYFDPAYFDKPGVVVPLLNVRQAPMSYDPQTGYFYVMGVVSAWWYRRLENPTVMIVSHPPFSKEHGIFGAIDSRTNKIVWVKRSPWGLAGGSGALSTAGGLLFHLEGDGNLNANDAKTGELLWQFQTGLLGISGAITLGGGGVPIATYEFDNEQYIAAPVANGLWTFKLGGALPQRAAQPPPPQEYGFPGIIRKLPEDGTPEIQIGVVSKRAEYVVDEYGFEPGRVRAKTGSMVSWTNYGVKNHTIVSDDGSFTTGEILPGKSVSVAMPAAGRYVFYSKEFPFSKGQLIVTK